MPADVAALGPGCFLDWSSGSGTAMYLVGVVLPGAEGLEVLNRLALDPMVLNLQLWNRYPLAVFRLCGLKLLALKR